MRILGSLKKISPLFMKNAARAFRSFAFQYLDAHKPFLNKMRYCGYVVYYTRGAGLIERIRLGSTNRSYEPELIQKISTEIKKSSHPVLLDIGTNIGLISLALLQKHSDITIYGFEPSPIPFKTFSTTIFANQLERSITLFPHVLNNKSGVVNFATHGGRNSSGDGMFDTMRTDNPAEYIRIPAIALDEWWREQKNPTVTHIKIDVEGAELLVLEGGVSLLNECRPTIFLEISKINLKVYPHGASDILSFFSSINYILENMNGVIITKNTLELALHDGDTFIAHPFT